MYNIISKTKYTYAFSIILTIASVISVSVWGLKLGIDFTGGTLMEIQFSQNIPSSQELSDVIGDLDLKSLTIQPAGNNSALIRYASESDEVNQSVFDKISEKYSDAKELRVDFINSSVSSELKKDSFWALFWALGVFRAMLWCVACVTPMSSFLETCPSCCNC